MALTNDQINRINAKLDILEEQQSQGRKKAVMGAAYEPERRRDSSTSLNTLDADMDKQERANYLHDRIGRLKELKSRYETAE